LLWKNFYIPEDQILEPFVQDHSNEPLEYRLLGYRISAVEEFPYSRRPHLGAVCTGSHKEPFGI
jgi:hypothetical protein